MTVPMRLAVADDVAGLVRPEVLAFEGVRVAEADPALGERLAAAARHVVESPSPADVVAAVRAMYRRVGLDPTKTRPSSEALLRRVRRGDGLPRVNNVVDVGNWCSLEYQLPYGLYDLDRIAGDVSLRLGRTGEAYEGIRKDAVHVSGRLVVADAHGAFGNPTSDSARTQVFAATTRVLVVIYVPMAVDPAYAGRAVNATAVRLGEFASARRIGGEATGG